MKTFGIRIKDEKNGYIFVELKDILEMIQNGNLLHWSILWLEASGDLGNGQSMILFEEKIAKNEKGLIISWEDLKSLSTKFDQIIELCIIGCKDKNLLNRYENCNIMYKKCDIVIEMIDGSFWEIHSNDELFINKIKNRFNKIELL